MEKSKAVADSVTRNNRSGSGQSYKMSLSFLVEKTSSSSFEDIIQNEKIVKKKFQQRSALDS